jgi:hypothetical protein
MDIKKDNDSFIKADGNKVINERYIRWIEKVDECLEVCIKNNGCEKHNLHKICKINNLDSYNKLNKYFE